MEGYGAFWLMVEAITRQIQDNPRDFVEYSAKKWRKITGISTKKYRKLLSFLEENGKILLENSEKNEKNYLKVSIPKLLEIADEYTKKRLRGGKENPENVRTKSVTTPSNVSLEKRRLEKIRVDKKDTYVVFDYWKSTLNHPKAKLTTDREAKIRARLNEGYSIDDLKRTIDGCKASSYHMGDNDQGKIYDSIELLFRNGDKVEQFWGYLKENKQEYQTQLSKAKAELGKLAGKNRIFEWLLILPEKAHNELRKHLDKIYRQGHSYAEAKDEWERRNKSPP